METIHFKTGVYLIQVKRNQARLLEDCWHIEAHLCAANSYSSFEKGRGRLETGNSFIYPLDAVSLDERWRNSGLQTLLVVDRGRIKVKTNKRSRDKSYWVSNMAFNAGAIEELSKAARGQLADRKAPLL